MRRYLYILFLLLPFISGCDKDIVTPNLIVSPSNLYLPVESSDVVSLELSCESNIEFSKFKITSQISGEFSEIEIDSSISGKSFNLRFEYEVPYLLDNTTILLDFILEDVEANIYRNAKMLEVTATELLLTETVGHEFFSGYSDKQNAYNLLTEEPLFGEFADSAEMHLLDESSSYKLSRKWVSPAGIKFVKFNDFDYANCTNISIRNSFESGSSKEIADDLVIGDILLLKYQELEESIYMAIKITGIYDELASDFDRYIFNLKK